MSSTSYYLARHFHVIYINWMPNIMISKMTTNEPITAPTITPALLSSSSPLLLLSAELPQGVGLITPGDDVLLPGFLATTQCTITSHSLNTN